jgi:hypothetical protein
MTITINFEIIRHAEFWKAVLFASLVCSLVLNLARLLVNTYTDYYWGWVAKWYDGWVGYYWDRKNRVLYLLPMPWFGISLAFPPVSSNARFRVQPAWLKRV